MTTTTPGMRPANPHFSSGPCAKRPGWNLQALKDALVGRSHRSKPGKAKLKLDTPYDFVSTCDIIGGNSGSPVIDKEGKVVGLIFDGNIQSLVLDFIYDEAEARAVSVDSRAIVEALDKVYDCQNLVAELTQGDGS